AIGNAYVSGIHVPVDLPGYFTVGHLYLPQDVATYDRSAIGALWYRYTPSSIERNSKSRSRLSNLSTFMIAQRYAVFDNCHLFCRNQFEQHAGVFREHVDITIGALCNMSYAADVL